MDTSNRIVDMTPKSIDIIENLALQDEVKKAVFSTCSEIVEDLDCQSEIFLVNHGSKVEPEIEMYLSDYPTDPIATIHASDERVDYEIPGNAVMMVEALKEYKEMPNLLQNEMAANVAENPNLSEQEKSEHATSYTALMGQAKKLKQEAKELRQQLKQDYKDDKEALKGLKNERENLLKEAQKAGLTPKLEDKIRKKSQEIENKTIDVLKDKERLNETKTKFLQDLKEKPAVVLEAAKSSFDKMGEWMSMRVQNGLGALASINKNIKEATERAKIVGKEMFDKLDMNVNAIDRNYLEDNYKLLNAELEEKKKLAVKILQRHDRKAEFANRITNVGKALTGQKFVEKPITNVESLTPKEREAYDSLVDDIKELKQDMQDIKQEYLASCYKDLDKIKNMLDKRKEHGMDEKKLDKKEKQIENQIKNARSGSWDEGR